MFKATNSEHAPWHIIPSDDKRRARLNCIAHLLEAIPSKRMRPERVRLPKRSTKGRYDDRSNLSGLKFVSERY
jgi:polyphosphate kinase